ncbi:isoaspartyl peptidase/L-asparaginase, partial [Paucibacter sp. O1-1]|nr:isoaspartyl peptidase/L-asparaginase [Paucibacter sp. O1-1]MDA3825272.1 isoaspartyl peptidase/L-asparaginase [Paucibacter sp. O1-1]
MNKLYLTFALCLGLSANNALAQEQSPITIAIHGGAGTINAANMTAEQQQAYRDKLTEAVNRGCQVFRAGGDSVDAVKAAINHALENSPLFNAGLGAVYTFDGGLELDASIMDG